MCKPFSKFFRVVTLISAWIWDNPALMTPILSEKTLVIKKMDLLRWNCILIMSSKVKKELFYGNLKNLQKGKDPK